MKEQDMINDQILNFIFNSSSEGIVVTDKTGVILKSNPKSNEIFGYTANESYGFNIIDFVDISDREKAELELQNALNGLHTQHKYYLLLKKNGERFFGEIKTSVIKKKNDNPESIIICIRDITTENKHLENLLLISEEKYQCYSMILEKHIEDRTIELKNAISDQEAFCYNVSHDLRTPLRAINGYSQILMQDYGVHMEKEGIRFLRLISDNTLRLGQLVDDLLKFSKLGRKEIIRVNTPIKKIVEDVLVELVPDKSEREIEIIIDSLVDAYVDPSLIRQVYINLLANAIKFTRTLDKAVIIIGSKKEEEQDVFYVKDNGVGFDMNYSDKIYGVFQRLHNNDEYEGTGVGLAIVKRIIEKHDGQIWVDSALNKGTAFYFTIKKTDAINTSFGEYNEKQSD